MLLLPAVSLYSGGVVRRSRGDVRSDAQVCQCTSQAKYLKVAEVRRSVPVDLMCNEPYSRTLPEMKQQQQQQQLPWHVTTAQHLEGSHRLTTKQSEAHSIIIKSGITMEYFEIQKGPKGSRLSLLDYLSLVEPWTAIA